MRGTKISRESTNVSNDLVNLHSSSVQYRRNPNVRLNQLSDFSSGPIRDSAIYYTVDSRKFHRQEIIADFRVRKLRERHLNLRVNQNSIKEQEIQG